MAGVARVEAANLGFRLAWGANPVEIRDGVVEELTKDKKIGSSFRTSWHDNDKNSNSGNNNNNKDWFDGLT